MCASRLASLQPETGKPCSALGDSPECRGGDPVLPHTLPHFLSGDPGAGQSWQENLPPEVELGSFCVFFLTHG